MFRLGRPLVLASLLASCSASGCLFPPDPMERRHAYLRAHPELDLIAREAILSGQLWAGMTADEALACAGEPDRIDPGDHPASERWVYAGEQNLRLKFLYFEDGALIRWSE